ncbi:MAG: nucleoside triphosphate pyrophosphohydrolase [Actinomycetia bacterium]|nr:nucleoside triphosphate pyrophosphohydrolase [Actinomycetes bacterium]
MSNPRPRVVVVGLGPAGPDLVTSSTLDALERIGRRFLRTTRHPAATVVRGAESFDPIYERAATIEQVYGAIVDRLVAEAEAHGEIIYAVPGSPAVAEHTVELLRLETAIELDVLPALSFLDLAWVKLGVDPLSGGGVRVVDGHAFATEAAGERGPLLVAQCDTSNVLSDIKLALEEPGDATAIILHHLGLPDERVIEVAWSDLDRTLEADHLTSVWVPRLGAPVAAELARFEEMVATLRRECPWDREQTHHSLRRHLLEETYEVLEAIDGLDEDDEVGGSDPEAIGHLEEELGDLIYQVYIHSVIAAEAGWFTLADVARGIHDKLYDRHPHVFGDQIAGDASDVVSDWEKRKLVEKGRSSLMDGVPGALPGLMRAEKLQKKAARAGFGFDTPDQAWADLADEEQELRDELAATTVDESAVAHELGDVLFAAVGVARHLGVDAETALREATTRFERRFRHAEKRAGIDDVELGDLDDDELGRRWGEAKQAVG